jgi:hypothetical protein
MEKRPEAYRPPTPVPGLDLRTWLAGCAMCNPYVVTSPDPVIASKQAVDAADCLLTALKQPKVASEIDPPSVETLKRWDAKFEKQKTAEKSTIPVVKRKTLIGGHDATPIKKK